MPALPWDLARFYPLKAPTVIGTRSSQIHSADDITGSRRHRRPRRLLRPNPEAHGSGFGFGASGDRSAFVTAARSEGRWSCTVFQMISGLTVS
jgi:hypothetical protein